MVPSIDLWYANAVGYLKYTLKNSSFALKTSQEKEKKTFNEVTD